MGKLSFVIASTPRSGTAYIAKLLRSIGIKCGHETCFTPTGHLILEDEIHTTHGDSSWMAAPFLSDLPPETVVIHQIRDPLKSINSLIYTGHLDIEITNNPYIDFINSYVPFPDRDAPPQDLAMFFWCYWHQLIEQNSSGRPYVRCKVEEFSLDIMLGALLHPEDASIIQQPTPDIPQNYNTRGTPISYLKASDLSQNVIDLASKYGYPDYLPRHT